MSWLQTLAEMKASAAVTGLVFGLPVGLWLLGGASVPSTELAAEKGPRVVHMALPMPAPPPPPAEVALSQPVIESEEPVESTEPKPAVPEQPTQDILATERRTQPDRAPEVVARSETKDGRKRRRSARKCEDDSPSISTLPDGTIEVERDLVQFYARHLKALDGLGYSVSHKNESGKAVGLRVGGFRCNNVAVQAGLKNGDVISAVNGKPVKSLVGAVWLYTRLHGKDEITLTVARRGETVSLKYKLV
jgi:membrane-associated protease RseP (regulator of RpoE activity)